MSHSMLYRCPCWCFGRITSGEGCRPCCRRRSLVRPSRVHPNESSQSQSCGVVQLTLSSVPATQRAGTSPRSKFRRHYTTHYSTAPTSVSSAPFAIHPILPSHPEMVKMRQRLQPHLVSHSTLILIAISSAGHTACTNGLAEHWTSAVC